MAHPPSLSPRSHDHLAHPVPRRERTLSQSERTLQSPSFYGVIEEFCREKGHGYIRSKDNPTQLIFAHVSDIDDDYVPKKGDVVTFKKMLMPPKNEKVMAVHIKLLHLAEGVKHESWEEAVEHDMEHRRPSRQNSIPSIQENDGKIEQNPSPVTHVD